jgi:hypothetical protein
MEQQADYTTEVQEAMEMLAHKEEVRVKNESNDHKYFTITPRIVKAYARTPHDLALWETIKDIAGESGECYLNTEQLAVLGGMSTGQVSASRKYWIKIGFLKGEIKKDPGYSQAVWHITVPDLWQKNVEWCERHPKIQDRLKFRMEHKSLHRMKPSPSENKPSPSETKKRVLKKNPKRGDILDGILEHQKTNEQSLIEFERAFKFGTLPWYSSTTWDKFRKFVEKIYTANPQVFREYVAWRQDGGKYQAFSNRKIRENPAAFMDTGYPEFEASKMYAPPAQQPGAVARHLL